MGDSFARRPDRSSSVGAVERLEPRLVLSSDPTSPLVGDAQFAFYDDGVYGTVAPSFERDTASFDSNGELVDADSRRFADTIAYAPPLEWSGTGIVPSPTKRLRILGSGWDHDGVTPLAVVRVEGLRLEVYRGAEPTLTGSISYDQLSEAAGEGRILDPRAAVVFNGLIVIACERREDTGNGYEAVGLTFLTTQDGGQTLQPVEQVGGGTDVPPIAGGVADGIIRGNTWSFLNAFPVGDPSETDEAWFPWADYLNKGGRPRGGQIGLFKATREAPGEPWTVEPNRLVYERWEPDNGVAGPHSHTAAMTTAGIVSHWGDTAYRNEVMLHEFDLDSYTTAPIETSTVFGGFDADEAVGSSAPQPVAAAPGVRPGEHFASGDFTREVVLQFGEMTSASDALEIDGVVDRPLSRSNGYVYRGPEVLHLHWMQGVGYVSSNGSTGGWGHFSPDGENWVAFNHAEQSSARAYLYGDHMLSIAGDNELCITPLPSVELVNPLALAPGGTNLIAPSLEERLPPAEGLTMRQVEFTNGLWRYADDGQPLDVQAEAPAFPSGTPIYEFAANGATATDFGSWWLQGEGETADLATNFLLESWVANLGDESVQLLTSLQAPSRGGRTGPFRGHEVATTGRWVALDYRGRVPLDGEGRVAAGFDLTMPAPNSRFLVAMPYLGLSDSLPYPLLPGASGPDEAEMLPIEPAETWTAGIVAAWPENATLNGTQQRPVLTLDGPTNGRVEVNLAYSGRGSNDRLIVSLFDGDDLVAENIHRGRLLRDETFEIVISGDGETLRSTARIGAMPVSVVETSYDADFVIDRAIWGDAAGNPTAIEPIVISADSHEAATAAEQRDWMGRTLRDKTIAFARDAPGDYNGDGVVDTADLGVVRDRMKILVDDGDPLDGNGDGAITEAEYAVWRQAYGTTGPNVAGDFNEDGVIDAADYTLLRDRFSLAVAVGESPDGDRDGRITEADKQVWREAYGTVVPSLADVLPPPRTDAIATSPEVLVNAVSSAADPNDEIAFAAAITSSLDTNEPADPVRLRAPLRVADIDDSAGALLKASFDAAYAAFAEPNAEAHPEPETCDQSEGDCPSSLTVDWDRLA